MKRGGKGRLAFCVFGVPAALAVRSPVHDAEVRGQPIIEVCKSRGDWGHTARSHPGSMASTSIQTFVYSLAVMDSLKAPVAVTA